ncbi:MAG: ABC transporter ATP-binding protein [bacterium]
MFSLSTKHLTKHFDGVTAVNKLSLSIEQGNITSIIGPNGSGKTTLVNLLSGIFPYDSGVVMINEAVELKKIKAQEIKDYGITRTFQDVRLFEQMAVLDNILVVVTERHVWSSLFERHGKFHFKIVQEVLEQVGLWDKRNELAINLSYGQRKLLEIARALAIKADIYLLDEPFAGLFKEMVKIVVKVIKTLKQQGKTVVLIEHNMDLIRELSDHVFVLDSGEMLAEGKPEKVLAQQNVVEAYLGE